MPENENEPTEPVVVEGAKPVEDEPLGEGGIKALKAEREAKDAAEKKAADLAAKLREIEDRDKSEAQKQQEALEEARKELERLTAEKNRAVVAADKSVPVALLAGPASDAPEDIAAFADALIQFRSERADKLHVANEGKSPTKTASDDREFVKTLFGSVD